LLAVICVNLAAVRAEASFRPRRVVVIGDSITEAANILGDGYPGLAQVILRSSGDTYSTALNRGWGGSTTIDWLASPTQARWDQLLQRHPDLTDPTPPPVATLAEAVVEAAQPVDTVVILLGINDRIFAGAMPAEVIVRLRGLRDALAPLANDVLISTLTPSPFWYPLIDPLNDAIRATFPDFVPLGDEFEAQPDWPDLLDGFLHPNAEGHAFLAEVLAADLSSRGLVGFLEPLVESSKCYKVRDLNEPRFVRTTVQLSDDLGDGDFKLKRPWLFCHPAGVDDTEPAHPEIDMACYRMSGPKLVNSESSDLEIYNAFGFQRLRIQRPSALCVPSTSIAIP